MVTLKIVFSLNSFDNFVTSSENCRHSLQGCILKGLLLFLPWLTIILGQCQETAADFHLAYGLWRFMAFRFTAYGKISESRQKPSRFLTLPYTQ